MTNLTTEDLRPYLQAFDFENLFVEGLGWDHYQAKPVTIRVEDRDYSLKPVAKKADFVVYECSPDEGGKFPLYPIRRKIESQAAKIVFEHLIVFVDTKRATQVWQWVKRENGKPPVYREQKYYAKQSGEPVLQRLQEIAFTLEDEAKGVGISDVTSRAHAFNVEEVTRRFYCRFKAELIDFQNFIEGITAQGNRDWYASLMLNRMMFVYFIQKRGFLDGDINYLRNRLNRVRAQSGSGRFQQFYHIFLLRLFHEGLGQPEERRAPELAELLGKIPFLNGGLFDVHELERDNPSISIPDEAFERIFDFFDDYRWHLDERPFREDREINPDVLGYIFEKYVNQKQMGAYYTKEDITGYISRNTVIPYLFDAAKKECPVAFRPYGGVWRLLRDDPDRYIYPAVGHGVTWNARQVDNPKPLNARFELPDDIADGIGDVSQRSDWNRAAPDEYALPAETWREVITRQQRHAELRAKLESGETCNISDLITLNLDIERFARHVITHSEGPELLRAFWHAIRDVSVLDPTCGSGAFLFAALNILEPLYTACLEGMRGFLDDLERSERHRHPETMRDFREVLAQVDKHHSERYFILKSIVLNNLYGVDIMKEAVEICKLRLFLKLVAQLASYEQIEPLPDIDFNIRAGNALVGFTSRDAVRQAMTITPDGQYRAIDTEQQETLERIEENADIASAAFRQFRLQQTEFGGEITTNDKAELRRRLRTLSDELDRYLAAEYGIDLTDQDAYNTWRTSHQPFHWFAEFYKIMSTGFDVVVGNPPFVEYRNVVNDYSIRDFDTIECGNLYYYICEQSIQILRPGGYWSAITPVASISSDRAADFRSLLHRGFLHWISSFSNRPAKLFDGVEQRLSFFISKKICNEAYSIYNSAGYRHWYTRERPFLFDVMHYVPIVKAE